MFFDGTWKRFAKLREIQSYEQNGQLTHKMIFELSASPEPGNFRGYLRFNFDSYETFARSVEELKHAYGIDSIDSLFNEFHEVETKSYYSEVYTPRIGTFEYITFNDSVTWYAEKDSEKGRTGSYTIYDVDTD